MKRILLLILLLAGTSCAADERILSYVSEITINADSSMRVTETIRVRSEGSEIKRGIYRDFPTRYKDARGNNYVVSFEVVEVRRDGRTEPYHVTSVINGRRVYIGDENVYLQPGEYVYTIVYRTDRQLGYFREHDELYWNATGNGWVFPIDQVTAIVNLPAGVPSDQVKMEGYTGTQGSKGQDYSTEMDSLGRPVFRTTIQLNSREGLTIVVSWPKGFVREPAASEKAAGFFRGNANVLASGLGLLSVSFFYLLLWSRIGKDPPKGTVIPLYTPPDGISPAAARYVRRMGYDNKVFSASLINMAVKRHIRISEANNTYTLTADSEGKSPLTPEEETIRSTLLPTGEIKLTNAEHSRVARAIGNVRDSLKSRYYGLYFHTNSAYVVPGAILSLLAILGGSLFSPSAESIPAVGMTIWLVIWGLGVMFLISTVIKAWKTGSQFPLSCFLTIFSLPFVGGLIFGLVMLGTVTSPLFVLIASGFVIVNYLFYHLLKAPTVKGRKLLDEIEGFKLYLSVAERDQLTVHHPREGTPELFEEYLPYAMALDVEQAWANRFAAVLAAAAVAGQAYQPVWYSGRSYTDFGSRGFASGLTGGLTGAVSSSSTAPGSSSGSGGGGSSGGGGGGGGGGGW